MIVVKNRGNKINIVHREKTYSINSGGRRGLPGQGVPTGGTDGQVLAKASDANYDTEWIAPPSAPVTSVNGQTGAVVLDQDDVADGTTYKQYSQTEKTKLAGIETGADVTDATNVDAAGATMNTDTSLAGNGYFLDEDDMASNSATKVPSQQSVKAYNDTVSAYLYNLLAQMIVSALANAVRWVEDDTTNVRYASPAGGGSGTAPDSPQTLSQANTSAVNGDTILLMPGDYTGIGGIGTAAKTLHVRPMVGVDPDAVRQTASEMVPARGSNGTLVIDGRKITSIIGTSGAPEYWQLCTPAGWAPNGSKIGILYLHGAGSNETQAESASYPTIRQAIHDLVDAGYPVLSVYAGGDTWGNATAMTRISEAVAYMEGTVGTAKGKISILGASMGGIGALNWAHENLSQIACVVGMTPVSDLTDIHTNNRGGLAASINSAYGGSYSEAVYGATRNPTTYAAAGELNGLNFLAYYGTSDAVVLPATVTGLVASIGSTATAISVAGSHGGALANIPPEDIVSYMVRHNERAMLDVADAGDVNGPSSSTNNAVATFNGTNGKVIKDSTKLLPSGTIVGTTDTQTLSGKTLTSPTINGATIGDATNIVLATGTGTKIGTATTQKLGFFNATPVVQQAAGTDLGIILANLGFRASGNYAIATASTSTLSGPVRFGVQTITATVSMSATTTTAFQFNDATSGSQVVTLPTAASVGGRFFVFTRIDATGNSVTIQGTGGQTINGAANYTLNSQYDYVALVSDNSNWVIYSKGRFSKAEVGLSNVDNTSDATKNSAVATLTNKTLTSPVIDTGVSGTAIDTDGTLTSNSDTKLASQKATKTYVDGADSIISGKAIPEAGAIQMRQPNLSSWYTDINDARAIPVDMVMIGDSISVLVDWVSQLANQLYGHFNTRNGLTNSVINQSGYLSAGGNYGIMNGTLQGTNAAHGCHIGPGYESAFGTNNGLYSFSAGNNATSPDAAALDITGDISMIAKLHLQSWIPGAGSTKTIIGKWVSSGQFAYRLQITTLGFLNLSWSTTGSNAVSVNSTIAVPFTNKEAYIGASLDVNNGASGYDVKFYTSLDGVTWTQLGTTVVGGATTSISSGTSQIEVGSTLNGTANFAVNTKIERTQIYSGLRDFTTNTGGTLAFDANFEAQAFGTTSFTESSANAATVTVNASAGTVAAINTLAGSGRELAIGNSVSSTNTCSGVYVVFKGGGGTLTVKDGGSGGITKATIDTSLYSGNNNLYWVDLTTYGSHNIYIECSVATTIIDGICTTAGNNTAGILMWRVGREGASSNYYSGYPGHGPNLVTRIKAMRSREPHAFIQTGYNDGTTTTYQTSINRLIDDIQTRTSGSILLMAPWQRGVGLEKSYIARSVATAQGTALVDAGRVIGDVSDYADFPAFSADGIHPNAQGGYALARMNYAVLSGDPIGSSMDLLWDNGRNYGDIIGTSFSLGAYVIATIFNIPIVTSKNTAADPAAEHTTYGSSLANVFLGYNKYVETWGDTLTAADVTVARARPTELSLNMGAAAIANRSSINGVAKVIHTVVGNVGTGEDDLMSWTSPANALSGDGQSFRVEAAGNVANNANAKTLKFYFGSTVVLTASMPTSVAAGWKLTANIIRTGAATQVADAQLVINGAVPPVVTTASPTQTLSSTSVIKCTGEATSNDDITQTMMKVYYDPNGV